MSARLLGNAVTAVVMLLVAEVASATGYARLIATSDPGDWVGQGVAIDVTYTNGTALAFKGLSGWMLGSQPASVDFLLAPPLPADNRSTLSFDASAIPAPLVPGTYNNAERANVASAGHPGLAIAYQGRACGSVTGKFVVDELTYGAPDPLWNNQPPVLKFRGSFEQHCEGAAPALRGTFVYDALSNAPVAAPRFLAVPAKSATVGTSHPRSINNAGEIVGDDGYHTRAFLFSGGTVKDIGTLGGYMRPRTRSTTARSSSAGPTRHRMPIRAARRSCMKPAR